MNRCRLAVLLLGLLAVAVGVTRWVTAPSHRITAATIRQLRVGQTLAEVEQLFGVPPGNYYPERPDRGWSYTENLLHIREGEPGTTTRQWGSEDYCVTVVFDTQDRVLRTRVGVFRYDVTAPLYKVRRWLRL